MSATKEYAGDDDSEPRYKRRRIAMACFSCRRRKSKCNGSRPKCDVCISMGFDCTYPAPPPSSFSSNEITENVRKLEDRLGKLESFLRAVGSPPTSTESHQFLISTQLAGMDGAGIPEATARTQDNGEVSTGTDDLIDPETATTDLADDTVDGMGAIAFADETASGHFGRTSHKALLTLN